MDKILEMPYLFNEFGKLDYKEMLLIINESKNVDCVCLSSYKKEGLLINKKTLRTLIKKIRANSTNKIMLEIKDINNESDINYFLSLDVDYYIIPLVIENNILISSYEQYLSNLLYKLKKKTYIKIVKQMNNYSFESKLFNQLKKYHDNFIGIIDEFNDYNFLAKLKDLNVILSLQGFLNKPYNLNIDGISSNLFFLFSKEIEAFLKEREFGFINPILKEYLNFIVNIVTLYPQDMAIKYLLSKNGFKSTYSLLPYFRIEGLIKEKLDFIL